MRTLKGPERGLQLSLSLEEARYAVSKIREMDYRPGSKAHMLALARLVNEKFHGGNNIRDYRTMRSFTRHVMKKGLTEEDFID